MKLPITHTGEHQYLGHQYEAFGIPLTTMKPNDQGVTPIQKGEHYLASMGAIDGFEQPQNLTDLMTQYRDIIHLETTTTPHTLIFTIYILTENTKQA